MKSTAGKIVRDTLEEIVELQTQYNAALTPAMERRGHLIRNTLPSELKTLSTDLRRVLGQWGLDATVEGKDNQGQMARIPWVRWFSPTRSPSATTGWYVVYLFHPDASGVSLCLGHGATQIVGTGFVNRTDAEVAELMSWAAAVLAGEFEGDRNVRPGVRLGDFDLARGYERTTVASRFYARDQIPDDEVLIADLMRFMRPLAKLYRAQDLGLVPGSISEEMTGALFDIQKAAAPLKEVPKGQGRGLTAPMRKLVELHAMTIAAQWLKENGFDAHDVSKSESFDFRAQRDSADWIVEVKGTTGALGSVLLTRNEVAAHRSWYPHNILLVVHGVSLSSEGTSAQGGELAAFVPWRLDEERLSAVCYEYRLEDTATRT